MKHSDHLAESARRGGSAYGRRRIEAVAARGRWHECLPSALTCALVLTAASFAQDGNPFQAQPAAKPTAQDAAQPAGSGKKGAARDTNGKAATASEPVPVEKPQRDVKEHVILDNLDQMTLDTPRAWLMAARMCLAIEAYSRGRQYVGRVLDTELDEAALLELHRRFGAAFFLQLKTDPGMQPEGAKLADRVLGAVRKSVADPTNAARQIEASLQAKGVVRESRVADLRRRGLVPVETIMQWLVDPVRHAQAAEVIRTWHPRGSEPLGEALSALWSLRLDHLELLPHVQSPRIPLLVFARAVSPSAPAEERRRVQAWIRAAGGTPLSPERLTMELRRTIEQDLREARRVRRQEPMRRESVWAWAPDKQAIARRDVWYDEWLLVRAGRAAWALRALQPEEDQRLRRLLWLIDAQLREGESDAGGAARVALFPDDADAGRLRLEPDDWEDALRLALDEDLLLAAVRLVRAMNAQEGARFVTRPDGQASLVVQCLLHTDRRLRFAALEAVARHLPPRPFAGSSRVIETLDYFLRDHGRPVLVIAHPRTRRATDLGAVAGQLGLAARRVRRGRDAMAAVARDAGIAAVLASDMIDDPPLLETVQAIRKTIPGRSVPILIATTGERVQSLRRIFAGDPAILVDVVVPKPEDLTVQLVQLLERAGRGRIESSERVAQTVAALRHARRIAETPALRAYLDIHRLEPAVVPLLASNRTAVDAAAFLAQLGTASAQSALLSVVQRSALPDRCRKAALVALAESLDRHGLRLDSAQVARIRHLPASTDEDRQVQRVLVRLIERSHAGGRRARRRMPNG